jgi:hypothetical protein
MSFNRLPKRIAGPGFHVNVRYDDDTIARHRTSTDSAAIVSKANSDEVYDVKEMELLVKKKESAMYYDGYTHCFSAVNGWNDTQGKTTGEVKQKILDEVDFVGVAVTEYQPSKAYSEQGFVSQVGGVVTLINEGNQLISPGQKVQLGLNLDNNRLITTDRGIPREKIRFCIEPVRDENDLIAAAMKIMKNPNNPGTNTCIKGDIKTALTALLKKKPKDRTAAEMKALDKAIKDDMTNLQNLPAFLRAYRQVNQRVIGKALGSAKRGDRVEVLLQPRHAY